MLTIEGAPDEPDAAPDEPARLTAAAEAVRLRMADGQTQKDAIKAVSEQTGVKKNALYRYVLEDVYKRQKANSPPDNGGPPVPLHQRKMCIRDRPPVEYAATAVSVPASPCIPSSCLIKDSIRYIPPERNRLLCFHPAKPYSSPAAHSS